MKAGSISEHKASIKVLNKYKLLPLAILYGANSSGKSNLIKALKLMNRMVLDSVKLNDTDLLPYSPFALDEISEKQPTFFEIQFIIKDKGLYRYGFEYNAKEIISEWLYEKCFGEKEFNLFIRSHDLIDVSEKRYKEGVGKEGLTNSNRLFLSLVAQLKGEKSRLVMDWFNNFNVLSGLHGEGYAGFTLGMFYEGLKGVDEATAFFRELQLGFNHFEVKKSELSNDVLERVPAEIKDKIKGKVVDALTSHSVFDESGLVIGEKVFEEDEMESEGTKKVIELSGPIFDTLNEGKVLIVDELDAKLHPLLTRNIVLLFMDPEKNKNNAQLVFATHDTNLLDLKLIRRDQIWFTEKDTCDSTDLYSLVEFKDNNGNTVRNDKNIAKDYITGRYGAIPFIGRIK